MSGMEHVCLPQCCASFITQFCPLHGGVHNTTLATVDTRARAALNFKQRTQQGIESTPSVSEQSPLKRCAERRAGGGEGVWCFLPLDCSS
jgi:hypothetical protein